MAIDSDVIIKLGMVESVRTSVNDPYSLRILARIEQDSPDIPTAELPEAVPLLPKVFQVVPKVGECVLIVTTAAGSKETQRYYIGPLISQPQYMEKCAYEFGRGPATSIIQGGLIQPLETIANYRETDGAFPSNPESPISDNDVSMVGRTTQDIILRHNSREGSDEVDIRCGIREKSPYESDKKTDLIGNIVFNSVDPAYIQLKYKKSLTNGDTTAANSIINMVADKINLISNQDDNGFNLTDPDSLIQIGEMDKIMSKLHQVPHGDTLLEFIRLFKKAFLTHKHNFNLKPPVYAGDVMEMDKYPLNDVLSKHIRVS